MPCDSWEQDSVRSWPGTRVPAATATAPHHAMWLGEEGAGLYQEPPGDSNPRLQHGMAGGGGSGAGLKDSVPMAPGSQALLW